MRLCSFAIAVALAVVPACRDDKLAPLRAVKDEVCACKTAACADEAIKRVPPPPGGGSADHRAQKLALAIQDCRVRAYERDRPTQDPDAEVPAEEGPAAAGSAAPDSAGSANPAP